MAAAARAYACEQQPCERAGGQATTELRSVQRPTDDTHSRGGHPAPLRSQPARCRGAPKACAVGHGGWREAARAVHAARGRGAEDAPARRLLLCVPGACTAAGRVAALTRRAGRMYALEAGMALPNRTADTNTLLGVLLKQLEARRVARAAPQRAAARTHALRGGAPVCSYLRSACACAPHAAAAARRERALTPLFGARRRRTSPRRGWARMTRCTWRASR